MIYKLLKLQWIRTTRIIRKMPLIAGLLSLIFLSAAGWFMFTQTPILLNACLIWVFITFILLSYHNSRKDYNFCRILLASRAKWWFLIQYLLIMAPFILVSLAKSNYLLASLYVSSAATAFLPRKRLRTVSVKLPGLLSPSSIELCGFLRKHEIPLALAVVSGSVLSFTEGWTLVTALGIALLLSDAYGEFEPRELLFLPEHPPRDFLFSKIRHGYALYLKLNIIPLLLYACFHIRTAYVIFLPLICSFIGICFYVCSKYAVYSFPPASKQNPLLIALGAVGVLIIPLLPLTILMTLYYYFSSKRNLSKYLYVYN